MLTPCPSCDAPIDAAGLAAGVCPACAGALVACERYRIRELLGRGGMATVYGATREPDGARVAVKVLVPRAPGDWLAWDLFERSSRVLAGLSHPALPTVYDFARAAPARLLLVREIFDGGTLAERIRVEDRRLTVGQVRRLLEALLQLLAYLHALVPPVVHRDTKPSNIMFRTAADWDPVLVDFDTIAAAPGQGTGLTIVATPGYTAPEQLGGDAGPASDLFSLGATLLFVVTHVEPDALPRAHGRFVLGDALAGLDPRLAAVLLQLVEPDRAARYAHAAEALRDLAPLARAAGAADEALLPLAVAAAALRDAPTLIRSAAPPPTEVTAPAPAPDAVPPIRAEARQLPSSWARACSMAALACACAGCSARSAVSVVRTCPRRRAASRTGLSLRMRPIMPPLCCRRVSSVQTLRDGGPFAR
ncbi:MAG TPA: serine/threonine-protein kinase [Polyangia bacterium]|jgi:serine/threonine protein kinase